MSSTAFSGVQLRSRAPTRRTVISRAIVAKGKKIDVKKQGVNSVKDDSVRKNLMGYSDSMKKKDWVDPQGRKGKGLGVYRFADKYGTNVDGFSPIYTPDIWSDTGDEYSLGTKGLLAWGGLIVVLLAVGVNLVVSTSQLGL